MTGRCATRSALPRRWTSIGSPPWPAARRAPRGTPRRILPPAVGCRTSKAFTERQWRDCVRDYWAGIAEFAQREKPELLVCLELHPGTVAVQRGVVRTPGRARRQYRRHYRPQPFLLDGDGRARGGAPARRTCGPCARQGCGVPAGGAGTQRLARSALAGSGARRCRGISPSTGRGHDAGWWRGLIEALTAAGGAHSISIEHEDPFVPPEQRHHRGGATPGCHHGRRQHERGPRGRDGAARPHPPAPVSAAGAASRAPC